MALLFMDGFDVGDNALGHNKWDQGFFADTHSLTGGRRNGGYVAGAIYLQKTMPRTSSTFIFGCAIIPGNGSSGLVRVYDDFGGGTTPCTCCLGVTINGAVQVRRGDTNGTVLCEAGNGSVPVGVWSYLEWKIVLHETTGSTSVRVNGVEVCSATGVDTDGVDTSLYDRVYVSAYGIGKLDDVYMLDGLTTKNIDFLGDCRVDAHLPIGDGNTHTFTPSTGSDHYAMVDEVAPNGDTDYNAASASGSKDTLVCEDLKNAGGTIKAVQLTYYAKKTDAGTASIKPIVRHSGTDNEGTEDALSADSYRAFVKPYNQNPNGGSAIDWTETDFNAAEFGYKKTA